MKRFEWLVLILLVVLAGLLRFYQLGNNPPALYWDETAIGLDAYSIAHSGRDINGQSWLQPIFTSYGDFKAPVYIWLASLSVKVLGLTPLAVRLPAAVFGTLLVILLWWLTKELLWWQKGKNGIFWPAAAAFLTAITPWTVHFSRIGFESFISLFCLVASLIFFLKALRRNGFYLVLTAIFAALAIYTYFSARVVIPLVFLGLAGVFKKQLWQKKVWLIVSIMLALGLIYPLWTSADYQQSQAYRLSTPSLINPQEQIIASSVFLERHQSSFVAKLVYHRFWFISREFLSRYFSHLSPEFLFLAGDPNLRHHSGFGGELLLVGLPFCLLGAGLLLKNWSNPPAKFLTILLLAAPIAASIPQEVPHASRAIYLAAPLIIITAWGLSWSVSQLNKRPLWLGVILLAWLVNAGVWFHDYVQHYPARSSEAWIYPYQQLTDYLKNSQDKFQLTTITEKYWQPQLYLLFAFPDLLGHLKPVIGAKQVDLSLEQVLARFNSDSERSNKPKVKFVSPEEGSETETIKTFYFLDGTPSLKLIKA